MHGANSWITRCNPQFVQHFIPSMGHYHSRRPDVPGIRHLMQVLNGIADWSLPNAYAESLQCSKTSWWPNHECQNEAYMSRSFVLSRAGEIPLKSHLIDYSRQCSYCIDKQDLKDGFVHAQEQRDTSEKRVTRIRRKAGVGAPVVHTPCVLAHWVGSLVWSDLAVRLVRSLGSPHDDSDLQSSSPPFGMKCSKCLSRKGLDLALMQSFGCVISLDRHWWSKRFVRPNMQTLMSKMSQCSIAKLISDTFGIADSSRTDFWLESKRRNSRWLLYTRGFRRSRQFRLSQEI